MASGAKTLTRVSEHEDRVNGAEHGGVERIGFAERRQHEQVDAPTIGRERVDRVIGRTRPTPR
jgi:DUF1009 family protein